MRKRDNTDTDIRRTVAWPLWLTRAGLVSEQVTWAFWPLWTLLFALLALLAMGVHEMLPQPVVLGGAVLALLAGVGLCYRGVRRFRWPGMIQARDRIDATLPGRPLATLEDDQAIGAGDAQSEYVWQAHIARMRDRARQARAVAPDLRIAGRDPFGLRYVAFTGFLVSLLFGSVWRVASVGDTLAPPAAALASGPAWEGWIEPPAYSGQPGLYLNDISADTVRVPKGSQITLRLYGEVGALSVSETVSGQPADSTVPDDDAMSHRIEIAQSGDLVIDGQGGRSWSVIMQPDAPPTVQISAAQSRGRGGEIRQPFVARDDYGVTAGTVEITLDLDAVERRHGLVADPEPREALVLDLPMPITGDRTTFEEVFAGNFSEHPWARMPVLMRFRVTDAPGQVGESSPINANLGGRRFFDPLAAAIVEQRRDLLWTRANGTRVVQILRAIRHDPGDAFPSSATYLKYRAALRQLEGGVDTGLTPELRDEVAQILWDLAIEIEDGDLSNARERLERAQDRLSEAMKRGASDEEIAELMDELREAMQDFIRELAQNQQQQQDGDQQQAENQQQMQELSQQDLQDMMDQLQELMEQGRMAEAQQLLEQLRQMMENMQVAQGEGGQQSPGQQAMEGLAETLRNQQGLSDDAFRDLQEQFNPGANAGESQQNQGRDGGQGRGQDHQGQGGQQGQAQEGDGQSGGQPGSQPPQGLAERQQALRDELRRQQQNMPGLSGEQGEAARDALDRAGRAMERAEDSLREDDLAGALDDQAEAMEALRDGMRNMGEALAQQQQERAGDQGEAMGRADPNSQRDPLGRERGSQGQVGTGDSMVPGADDRARDLLDEIRRRSSEQERPQIELDYLRRLLDRF
ncbi:TIGR02302 family protein [Actibacterium ureilyticum]|uniref:TIGR02302 family protein n=1 Tax=Actibacterium ureilyticum TaxID=1590614 RepID=UPI000BAAB3D3|nr:TIGR02302 family protein [Actibacterium ureilyticum]